MLITINLDTLLLYLLAVLEIHVSLHLQASLPLEGLDVQIARHLCFRLFCHLGLQVLIDSQLAKAWQVGLVLLLERLCKLLLRLLEI